MSLRDIAHDLVAVDRHRDGAADADVSYNSGTGACSNVNCHNNLATASPYRWYDAGTTACVMCHTSGGSAGNTIAGVASLGGKGAFIGKVNNDQFGGVFRHDIRSSGVTFETPSAEEGPPTARCLIFVTPDAQRTMQTFLGATTQLGPEDLDMDGITSSKVVYLEGYLWDQPRAKTAMRDAAITAHKTGVKVALTLSAATLTAVLLELGASVARAGMRNLLPCSSLKNRSAGPERGSPK